MARESGSELRREAVILHLLDRKQAGLLAVCAGGDHALVADEQAAIGRREAALLGSLPRSSWYLS